MGEPIKIYKIPEVAEILGLHARTVLAYCEKGKLKARKIGRSWTISEKNLREFIDTPTNTPTEAGATAGN